MGEPVDLLELCRQVVDRAERGEHLEAYAQESRRTEVRVRGGEVESLSFSETRGVGVRTIVDGRLGYAYAADPSPAEIREIMASARANAAVATADEWNALPPVSAAGPLPELFRESQATLDTGRKLALALDLDRVAVRLDARVRKVESVGYGDVVSRVAIASTEGEPQEYRRTDCWCAASALADDGAETQTGYSFRLAREADDLDWEACAQEAVERAARLLGATKPTTARLPVVLDPHVGVSFLGVLSSALSADAVQKGRSLFAPLVGEKVGSDLVNLIDDGRLLEGPAAAPFDDEGVATQRTALIDRGALSGFLHNTYTARRGGALSTGNAGRAGYRSPPGVSASNLFVSRGDSDPRELLSRADGGVYVQEVSGVHSGANPISGEFSVGATGLRIKDGALGEPLREMTIASTLLDVLGSVTGVGKDLRFFGAIGAPTLLVDRMTVAGV